MLTGHRVVLGIILIYSCLALLMAFGNRERSESVFTLSRLFRYASLLQSVTNCVQRDSLCLPLSAYCRNVAEQLPPGARVFMSPMLGPENGGKLGYYYFMANYLFPREVAISMDRGPSFVGDYYLGRNPTNAEELIQAGYHFAFDIGRDDKISVVPLARLPAQSVGHSSSACRISDQWVAGALPVLAAILGLWLLATLFGFGPVGMAGGERFACGLALGSLFISQILFGFRLLGLAAEQLMFWLLLAGSVALVICRIKSIRAAVASGFKQWFVPASLLLTPHLVLLAAVLWLAGLEGSKEFDAVAGWTLKAKIIYLCRGHEIIQWFSEPRLAHTHLDYPVLVPTLEAFSYGVLGRVNEFVIKYWPAWMTVALAVGILSMCRFPSRNRLLAPALALAVLCMPVIMQFTRAEGGTIPSVLFTSLGCIQCSLAVAHSDKKRLWLGMFLLLGATMTKFEGMAVLGLWILALLCRAATRTLLIPGRKEWILLVVALGLVVPYGVLRLQIPQLHPDQLAIQTIQKHPVEVAARVPRIFSALVVRQCVDDQLAAWTVKNNDVVWTGKWIGWKGLVNSFNFGWGWLCVVLSIALLCLRATRYAALTLTLVALGFLVFIAAVYCGLPYMFGDMQRTIDITANAVAGRHVAPMLFAWGLGLIALAVSTPRETPATAPVAGKPA
jgi:hypothetical protein